MTERKMQITADNEKYRRYHTNLGLISHRNEVFILEFPFLDPQIRRATEGQAMLISQSILNPEHMQRLYQAIGDKPAVREELRQDRPPADADVEVENPRHGHI